MEHQEKHSVFLILSSIKHSGTLKKNVVSLEFCCQDLQYTVILQPSACDKQSAVSLSSHPAFWENQIHLSGFSENLTPLRRDELNK